MFCLMAVRLTNQKSILSLNSLLNNGRKPFFFQSDNRFHKIKRLIAPLYRNESIFGTLALSDVSAEFTPGEYLNVVQIQTFIEQAIQHTTDLLFQVNICHGTLNSL